VGGGAATGPRRERGKAIVGTFSVRSDCVDLLHEGKIHIRRVSKIEHDTGETLSLDLIIVTPEIRRAWESRAKVEWEGGALSVVSPEGLILLKSFRRSGQDQDDIQYLRSILDED